MPKVISIHEYELKPGLEACCLVKGIKGYRREAYAAIWVYASQESWERNWGPVGSPRGRAEYPPGWLTWEKEDLSQFLEGHADEIRFTSYLSVS